MREHDLLRRFIDEVQNTQNDECRGFPALARLALEAKELLRLGDHPSDFPVHPEDVRNIPGCPHTVPWAMLAPHEQQALQNHDQTLQRLAERGGLGLKEMLAVLDDRKLFPLLPATDDEALRQIVERVEHWKPPSRAESGPMKFGDDWTGVFFRGDNALHFAMQLEAALDVLKKAGFDGIGAAVLDGLRSDLLSCLEAGPPAEGVQRLKAFDDCR